MISESAEEERGKDKGKKKKENWAGRGICNAPELVIGVDVPDDALREDLVLIHGDQSPKHEGRQFGEQQRVGRPVAFEGPVR